MACDPQDLLNDFGGKEFAGKTYNEQMALKLALLCKIYENGGGGGGTTWGSDGDNMVRPIGNVYVLDTFTSLYHKMIATSEFSPGIVQLGADSTGYTYAAIPD